MFNFFYCIITPYVTSNVTRGSLYPGEMLKYKRNDASGLHKMCLCRCFWEMWQVGSTIASLTHARCWRNGSRRQLVLFNYVALTEHRHSH